ncbi:arginine--tRNA ligase [Patescibacteria group bacterium]|nr:arginine--tRNA ligase [Patescibacteria group bacterium]
MTETSLSAAIKRFIETTLGESAVILEHPAEGVFGDYSTNIAMTRAKAEKKNPREIASQLVEKMCQALKVNEMIEKIEVAGPGFINFYLQPEFLIKEAEAILDNQLYDRRLANYQKGKRYLLEHTSPEPTKTLHIGHFRNNFLGMSVSFILAKLGAGVTLDCINNDRGMKICKTMWGYLYFGHKTVIEKLGVKDYINKVKNYHLSDEELLAIAKDSRWTEKLAYWYGHQDEWYRPTDFSLTSDKFDNVLYSPASRAAELQPEINEQVQSILKAWEGEDDQIRALWRLIIQWSMEGYAKTYQRIESHHDKVWNESDFYKEGKAWVVKGLDTGVFKKLPDGAVLTNLESYHLPDTIVIKSNGTSMYLTQDLQLTSLKVSTFPADKYVWVVGNDQQLYLKQMFSVCEQLGIVDKEKLFHLNYGFINLKDGKMSSRYGGVINGDDLLDELKQRSAKIIETGEKSKTKANIEEVAEKVAVAACKFGFLRYDREKDITFDIDESLSLQGDSGPYVQYTYARCESVIKKSQLKDGSRPRLPDQISPEESQLLRLFYLFEEKIVQAGETYNPAVISGYLLEVARTFNEFYAKQKIIGSPQEAFRLFLTRTSAAILKTGLELLGITTLEEM